MQAGYRGCTHSSVQEGGLVSTGRSNIGIRGIGVSTGFINRVSVGRDVCAEVRGACKCKAVEVARQGWHRAHGAGCI